MKRRLSAAALVLSALLAACGGDSGTTSNGDDTGDSGAEQAIANTLDVTMQDFAFAVEGEATAGPAVVTFSNVGEQLHHAIVGKLGEGKTLEDVQALLDKGLQGPPPPWFDDSPIDETIISPGESSGIVLDLEEGTYVLLCFMPDPEGQPHVAHGMVQSFDVAAGEAEPLEADASISMTEEGAEAPELPAGESLLEVSNDAEVPGEIYIVQAEGGIDSDAIDKWFRGGQKGDPPAQFFGGTHTFGPGESVILQFNLEPGDYQIVASYGEGKDIKDLPTDFTVE